MVFLYGANFYKNTVPAINPQVIIGGQILASSAVSEKIKRKKEIERMKQERKNERNRRGKKGKSLLWCQLFQKHCSCSQPASYYWRTDLGLFCCK